MEVETRLFCHARFSSRVMLQAAPPVQTRVWWRDGATRCFVLRPEASWFGGVPPRRPSHGPHQC
eukprot:8419376-Lingulodinium_polyedra.AAC.1